MRSLKVKGLIAATLIAAGVAVGCGESGPTQEELDAARAEGAKEAGEQAKVDRLRRQVQRLRRQQAAQRSKRERGDPPVSPAPQGDTGGPAKACTDGVGASSSTSCEFAMNVAGEYGSNPGATTIGAYSPVSGEHYTLSCAPAGAWSAVCTGGNGAVVYIP